MLEAFFANRTVSVLVEALPRILTAGLTMTIPLTLVSFFFAMIIAVAVALVQYANVPVLRQDVYKRQRPFRTRPIALPMPTASSR